MTNKSKNGKSIHSSVCSVCLMQKQQQPPSPSPSPPPHNYFILGNHFPSFSIRLSASSSTQYTHNTRCCLCWNELRFMLSTQTIYCCTRDSFVGWGFVHSVVAVVVYGCFVWHAQTHRRTHNQKPLGRSISATADCHTKTKQKVTQN